ncbi:MAG TPA: MgtC/SapB family protein [Actinomycetota bacterium]|nr:MgtC/SapB family protein [Actinomycetota bacterium]
MRLATQAVLIGRIALGAALGYAIGFEREYRGKPAGERTFGLLALGASAVTGVGVLFFPSSAEKVIAGVITGVGFLGAGLIFRERDEEGGGQPLGLTTAASSWAAAAVGILAGAGLYLSSVVACVFVLVILEVNRVPIYRRIVPGKERHDEDTDGYDPRRGMSAHPTREDDRPEGER